MFDWITFVCYFQLIIYLIDFLIKFKFIVICYWRIFLIIIFIYLIFIFILMIYLIIVLLFIIIWIKF